MEIVEVYKRSEIDEQGNPYPILYMKLNNKENFNMDVSLPSLSQGFLILSIIIKNIMLILIIFLEEELFIILKKINIMCIMINV